MQLVNISEYGRMRGIDKSVISRQVEKGIIKNHGVKGRPLIDVDEADQARAVNLDISKSPKHRSMTMPGLNFSEKKTVPATKKENPPAEQEKDYPDQPASEKERTTYQNARTARETINAKTAHLNYLERAGDLVSKNSVATASASAGGMIRDKLMALIPDLADKCFGITDAIQLRHIIRSEFVRLLTDCSNIMEFGQIQAENHENVPENPAS